MKNEILITNPEMELLKTWAPSELKTVTQIILRSRSGLPPNDPNGLDDWMPLLPFSECRKPRPLTEYLVQHLLPAPSVVLFYGPGGSMKSLLLMDMALCVAAGKRWLDSGADGLVTGFAVQQTPVMWIDLDQGQDIVLERLNALGTGHGLGEDLPLWFKSDFEDGLDLLKRSHLDKLVHTIRSYETRLTVIDTLSLAKGAADENSTEMVAVISGLRRVANETRSVIVAIHHSRKSNGFISSTSEKMRGSTSISASVDLSVMVERDDELDLLKMSMGKQRRCPFKTFGAQFQFEHYPESDDLRSAIFRGMAGLLPGARALAKTAVEDRRQALSATIDSAVLEALSKGQLNQGQVITRVLEQVEQASREKIRQRLEALAEDRRVIKRHGINNASLYERPGAGSQLELESGAGTEAGDTAGQLDLDFEDL